tara:strand:- start:93 stop:1649 length:1557 start_codon:yes stop_codon:yes gene_type:complete
MNRVAPRQVNYDNILPLAIESRSNRREFLPVNGQEFSNATGATICRIDVNADSMLDASHSYFECRIENRSGTANNTLLLNPFCPSWVQRLRIESGGVVIEDINEYARLYAMLVLNQCPQDYIRNNLSNQGLYFEPQSPVLIPAAGGNVVDFAPSLGANIVGANAAEIALAGPVAVSELIYMPTAQAILKGLNTSTGVGPANNAVNQPNANGRNTYVVNQGVLNAQGGGNETQVQAFPLVSGFLNMDKYIPLVMMNAGFTLELTLSDANRIGCCALQAAGGNQDVGNDVINWRVVNCKYVAHLIDLDRSFYDTLRSVMESSGGVLQLAGQTYRHFVGTMPAAAGTNTITLPARVKSVKSIFGTFIQEDQMGGAAVYDTSVFQRAGLSRYRFEIGSVRYPQTDVVANSQENDVELQKAFGKLGDYSHQQAYSNKHTRNDVTARAPTTMASSLLSAYFIGYDFEAFQRVALEAGINTADRSLPINFIATKAATAQPVRADFYVLTDAIYYINLDGTVSVSV